MATAWRNGGFTLVELTVVVAVIGLLAALALPDYQSYLARSKVAEAFALVQPARQAVTDYYAHTGRVPTDNRAAGLILPGDIAGQYVASVEVVNGAINVQMKGIGSVEHGTLSLRPGVVVADPHTALLTWTCGYAPPLQGIRVFGSNRTDLPEALLPPTCRSGGADD